MGQSGTRADREVARRVVRESTRYAGVFAHHRPAALVWRGLEAALLGRRSWARKLWTRAIALAREQEMPFEEASALLHFGRLSSGKEREERLLASKAAFAAGGSLAYAARAEALLQEG